MQISHSHSKRQWVTLFFVLVATLPFSFNCIEPPADFKAPTWETPLNLTLVTKTFTFSDMVSKDSHFDTTTGVVLYKPTENAIGSRKGIPAEVFNMPSPQGNTINQSIGVVPVDIGTPPSFALTAADLGISSANFNPNFDPQSVTLNNAQLGLTAGSIPPFTPDPPAIQIQQTFGDSSQYKYLVFEKGKITLTITNNYPFSIGFSSNTIQLVNYSDTNQVVATFTFAGPIATNTSAVSDSVDLTNVKMDAVMKFKTTMQVIGWAGTTITNTQSIVFASAITGASLKSIFPDPAPPVVIDQAFGDETDFKHIIFDNGQMKLSITNNFPFTIQFAGNSVKLVNQADTNEVVANFLFSGAINPNTSAVSNTVPLSNVKMDALMKFKGTVIISNYFGKTVSGTDKIVTTLNLTQPLLKTALVNSINFRDTSLVTVPDSAIKLDDSIKVKLAKFKSGSMRVKINNNTGLKLSVKFSISELSDNTKGGAEYKLPTTDSAGIVTIAPNGLLDATILMKDVSFVSRERKGSDTVSTQNLHFKLEIKTLKASSGYVSVSNTDNVIADVQPEGSFVLDEVQGKIPPQSVDINQSFDVGIGDISDKFTLRGLKSAIKLAVSVLSTGLFPTDVNLYVAPQNKAGQFADSIQITKRILPGESSEIPIDTASVNKLVNSFLATTGELPFKFYVRGKVTISPLDVYLDTTNAKSGVGKVNQKDSIFVNMDYAIPVAIGIKDGILKSPPTEFSQTLPDTAQINLIKNGKIYLDVMNTFPLDVEMKIKLLKGISVGDSLVADTVSLPALTIPQIPTDSANYPPLRILADTTAARTGQRSFTFLNLTPDDAKKLGNASFSAIDINMKTSGNGNTAKVFNLTDKLVMTVKANIIFLVDQDKLK